MNKLIIITLNALLMLTSSCGIYRKYERPDNLVTDSLFGEKYHTVDTTSIVAMCWKELFTDPLLQVLIQKGLDNNTDIQSAELRVEAARTNLQTARLAYLPIFNFSPEAGNNVFKSVSGTWTYSVPVTASWELDLFGKLTNTKRMTHSSFRQSLDYCQTVQTNLIAEIATQYYTLLMLDEQLRIALETTDKFYKSVKVMRSMKNAGLANEVGVAQMEGAYYEVKASAEDLKRSINEVENTLSTLLCETPHAIERGTLSNTEFPQELKTGLPVNLLSNRPDVRYAEESLIQAYYAVNISRAALYPALNLSGSAGWTNSLGSTVANPAGLLLSAAGSLFMPVLNARSNINKVKIAKTQQEEAQLFFQQTILNAGAEVNNALTQYQTALAKSEWRSHQVSSLITAVNKTEKLMEHTSTTYLDVLTAQQSLLSAQTAQAQDKFEMIQSVINLYHALGGDQTLKSEEE